MQSVAATPGAVVASPTLLHLFHSFSPVVSFALLPGFLPLPRLVFLALQLGPLFRHLGLRGGGAPEHRGTGRPGFLFAPGLQTERHAVQAALPFRVHRQGGQRGLQEGLLLVLLRLAEGEGRSHPRLVERFALADAIEGVLPLHLPRVHFHALSEPGSDPLVEFVLGDRGGPSSEGVSFQQFLVGRFYGFSAIETLEGGSKLLSQIVFAQRRGRRRTGRAPGFGLARGGGRSRARGVVGRSADARHCFSLFGC
mmetsp:Transcript_15892/g.36789  ORF Transcript_15892/g.36789 Transcript_15892/m.36789 type:complete len:253 (-) Transcript_15892:114-872(-)